MADYEGPPTELVDAFRRELRKLIGAKAESKVALSDVQGELIQQWLRLGHDPEFCIADWVRDGVPLGIKKQIPTCGIFPPGGDHLLATNFDASDLSELLLTPGENYSSCRDRPEDTVKEIQRNIDAGNIVSLDRQEAAERFPDGNINKLGIIVTERPDPEEDKRRMIVDARESKINERQTVKERVVLPRGVDVARDARTLAQGHAYGRTTFDADEDDPGVMCCGREDSDDEQQEFFGGDVVDAYTHLAVHPEELNSCLSWPASPSQTSTLLLWIRLFFGLRSAPVIWCRFAAALMRIVQSVFDPHRARGQVYIDDILFLLRGNKYRRDAMIALFVLLCCAFNIRLSWKKAVRGTVITWIGIVFHIELAEGLIRLTITTKYAAEMYGELLAVKALSMVGLKRLRRLTGKLSWAAGVVPRSRWTVSIFYGVLADAQRAKDSGEEEKRRTARKYARDKSSLVAVSRLGLAIEWATKFWAQENLWSRRMALAPVASLLTPCVDASPWGLGGVLLAPNGKVVEYFADVIQPHDVEFLGVEIGSCRSQSTLEALAVLVAVRLWSEKLGGQNVRITLRADNMAALALSNKLSSSSPTLNFLGAELSLQLEIMEVEELNPGHIFGTMNSVADALSRLAAPNCALFPAEAFTAKERKCPARDKSYYRLPPPERNMNEEERMAENLRLPANQQASACPWSSRQMK